MKAIEMVPYIAYRAITSNTNGCIKEGNPMWLSENGLLNLPDKYSGGALLEEEWKSDDTVDFEVEEMEGYYVEYGIGYEMIREKR